MLLAAATTPLWAEINIQYPSAGDQLMIMETPIAADSIINNVEIKFKNGKASYKPLSGPAQITLLDGRNRVFTAYIASPAEKLNVTIPSDGPVEFKGSTLMNDISSIIALEYPIEQEYSLINTGNAQADEATVNALLAKYYAAHEDFIAKHPDSPAAPYALLALTENDFLDGYNALTPLARQSIVMPVVERQKTRVEKQMEMDARIAAMQNGTFAAPQFTLPGLDGNPISLSQYKGKWVVLDFWGAWCRWCIKGFPQLKEAYKNYDGRFEVIGIDNRDSLDRWRSAVQQYELPWVNVYNDTDTPEGTTLLEQYAIQGFPTKVIIDPEGIIRHITVGEDPAFYDTLNTLLTK